MQMKTLKMSSTTTGADCASYYPSDYKTSQSDEDDDNVRQLVVQNLPGINLPEKILFVIDTVREKDCTPFKFSKGTNYMPLFMIKRVVEHFICIKSTIQHSHEYALMILNSHSAEWICNFTNNINSIIDTLDLIDEEIIREEEEEQEGGAEGEDEKEEEEEGEEGGKEGVEEGRRGEGQRQRGGGAAARQKGRGKEKGEEEEEEEQQKKKEEEDNEKSYDLGQLFDKIESRIRPLSSTMQEKGAINDIVGPKFVTRVILLYSRSTSIPKFISSKTSLDNLTKNPYFFVDVLYVHEPPCSENVCEEIYSEIAKLDTKNVSYILEVGRNAAKLHDNMAKLLAHPLQRPAQKDVCYAIYRFTASQETYITV